MVDNAASARPPNRPRVTLTLTSNVERFIIIIIISLCRCPVDHLCQFASESAHSFSKYCPHKFGNRRMYGRTDGQVENIMPPACQYYNKAVTMHQLDSQHTTHRITLYTLQLYKFIRHL